ncbi:hypothetical protein Ae201684P_018406 [Aphanomyces euteiches]|nr:hypothetical protein Ae201684P_018406 [Aphanomyces euteiches]
MRPKLGISHSTYVEWSPLGAKRFLELIQDGFYDNAAFFRYVPDFVVQWGLAADPKRNDYSTIVDDKIGVVSNTLGTISFATSGRNSRTTQVFVNLKNNSRLDSMGFTPFGIVTEGMDVLLDKVYSGYREEPDQRMLRMRGEAYLERSFPKITHITKSWVRFGC